MKQILLLIGMVLTFSMLVHGQSVSSIKALNERAIRFRDENPDSLALIAEKALQLSQKINYVQGQIDALTNLGFSFYVKGDNLKAESYYLQGINLGNLYPGKMDNTLPYHFLSLVYINQSKHDAAIKVLHTLFDKASKSNNLYLLADVCGNLGLSYMSEKNYEKAYQYLQAADKIHSTIDFPLTRVYSYLNFGRLFFELQQYDSSTIYLEKTIALSHELNNVRAEMYANNILGQIAQSTGKINEAENNFLIALEIADSLQLNRDLHMIHSGLAELYFSNANYDKAIISATLALEYAQSMNLTNIIQSATNILVKSYIQKGDLKMASQLIDSLEKQTVQNSDSSYSGILRSILFAQEMKAEDQSLVEIKHELILANAEINRRNLLILASVATTLLSIIILALIARSNQLKSKNHRQLIELNDEIKEQKSHLESMNHELETNNKEKDLLLAMVAHDLRSPLNKITGLMNILKLEEDNERNKTEVEEMVLKTVIDANLLVDELLEIHKIDSGILDLKENTIDLHEFITNLHKAHLPNAQKKNIGLSLSIISVNSVAYPDSRVLQRILDNLLTNAIKFSDTGRKVSLIIEENSNRLWFTVKDNGRGIAKNEHPQLFTKFGKTSTRPTGGEPSNGLGLYIVDRLTKALGGIVTFESEAGSGSSFTVSFGVK